jgi:hypothetical protein
MLFVFCGSAIGWLALAACLRQRDNKSNDVA